MEQVSKGQENQGTAGVLWQATKPDWGAGPGAKLRQDPTSLQARHRIHPPRATVTRYDENLIHVISITVSSAQNYSPSLFFDTSNQYHFKYGTEFTRHKLQLLGTAQNSSHHPPPSMQQLIGICNHYYFKYSTKFTHAVLQLLGMTKTYYWVWWKLDTCNQSYFKYSTECAHALLHLFGKIHYICSFHVWIPAGFHFISLHISITCTWDINCFCLIFMLKLSNKYHDNYAYSIIYHALKKLSHTGLCYI